VIHLALFDPGRTQAACWQQAADRRDDVQIVDEAAADAVVVADLSDATRELAGGRHVLLCPSVVTSVSEAESLAVDTGPVLMLASVDRYRPSTRQVHDCTVGGELGEPGLLRVHRWLPGGDDISTGWLAGDLDLAIWLFGALPGEVYAVKRGEPVGYVHAHLGFSGGGMALIDVATTLPDGDGYFSLSMIGGDGSAYADDHHNMHLIYGGGLPRAQRGGEGVTGLVNLLGEFVAAINESRPASPGPADAHAALLVAEAAERSIEVAAPLKLNESGDGYEPG